MKSKSITSVVALVGATVLNLSALAGPGPQPQFQTRNVSTQKSVSAPSVKVLNVPTIAFGGTKSSPKLVTVPGPHGTAYFFR